VAGVPRCISTSPVLPGSNQRDFQMLQSDRWGVVGDRVLREEGTALKG
jgi:hypothetical protein